MKKLMIAAAVVCAAAMSQAASITWGEGNKMFTPDPANNGAWTETSLGKKGTAYFFELSKAQYDALFVSGDYAATAEKVFNEYATVSDAGKITVSGQSGDPVASSTGKVFYDDSRTFAKESTAYAAMIITTTGDDGKDYYIANIASHYFAADMDDTSTDMGHWQFGDSTSASKAEITGWTAAAVPEPTSGLLLLLGVAGLALRRRRA